MTSPLHLLLIGTGVLVVLMTLLWIIAQNTKNAGIVDVGWAASLALLALLYAYGGSGYAPRRLLVSMLVGIWGLRLAFHLLTDRVIGKPEEARYAKLRARWKTNLGLKFFFFFQAQALLNVFLSIPFLLMSIDTTPRLSPWTWAGTALWFVAVMGESIADRQLKRFKHTPSHQGKTCRIGLWRYSRHPNYFFEWLVWVSFALAAWPSPYGAFALLPMAVMWVVLTQFTGVAITEAHLVQSRGDYRDYQRTTNAFFPWFPRA